MGFTVFPIKMLPHPQASPEGKLTHRIQSAGRTLCGIRYAPPISIQDLYGREMTLIETATSFNIDCIFCLAKRGRR